MRKEFFRTFFTLITLQQIYGHGRMEEPPARNAAWRFGFDVPANYDDVGLNCGGLSIQRINHGKCGVCGDAFTGPRDHEIGGKYATNIVVRHYVTGSLIDVKILITANHVGFMEFRLCPATDSNVEVTQECLDENILHIEGYGQQYPVQEGMGTVVLKVHLPEHITCARCVFQWRYHAGNSWGTDLESGHSCLGCGLQEEFYNCADISISPRDYISDEYPIDIQSPSLIISSSSSSRSSTPTASTTTMMMNVIYPYGTMNEIEQDEKLLHCYPTNEVLKPLVGIEKWCRQLCRHECPPSLCVCVNIS